METAITFQSLLQTAVSEPGYISKAYSAFHNYSLGNQLAAAFQCSSQGLQLGPIATFKAWQDKGRHVKKGSKAIVLCMPVTCKVEKETESGETESVAFNRFVWRKNWFVLDQTEGQDYQQEVVSPEWDKKQALEMLGITEIEYSMPNGNCQGYATGQNVAINPVAAFPHKTRFHEMAHVVLGHTKEHEMKDSEHTPRDIKEVEAESVAFILCSLLNLPGLDESRGYIQSWLGKQEVPEKSAQKIFNVADKILKAGKVGAA